MAFENPCSLEHMDTVLQNDSNYLGWIAIQNDKQQNRLCVEGMNGYSFVFYGDTEDQLKESIKDYIEDVEYITKRISLLELLHDWRAIVYNKERSLIMGCRDYLCDTALSSPGGMLYPHAFSLISYLLDEEERPMVDEWGSLICAGSPTRLIQTSCYDNKELLLKVYGNKVTIRTEPLIFLAKRYKSLLCEGSSCNVPMALAHSYHARNSNNV
jgi:hypothetical protein